MRILFLAGTNSIHSHRWANYFAHAGHEVHVVSFARTIQPVL
ncbi:MAG: Glycosyl transferase group 1, partial [Parcubacteria group bacterium GW2011_GWA1_60_11]